MVRMANVYLEEGSLENAYILYLKFMSLFLEKIRKHPEFSSVTSQEKATNQMKLREVLPKAEKLKQQLLQKYTEDYNRYVQEEVSYLGHLQYYFLIFYKVHKSVNFNYENN